jgi:hypothetical protein
MKIYIGSILIFLFICNFFNCVAAYTVNLQYNFTLGVNYTFIPPVGVSSVNVELVGGSGGADCSLTNGGNQIALGGRGAIVRAQLLVTAGNIYYINIGEKGQDRTTGITITKTYFGVSSIFNFFSNFI